jgi:murein DD-endopeptidase MepM/ murein hydrolase activator NlpD
MHTGLDLIVPEGTPVFSVLPGTVRLVDAVGGYGLVVVVDHGLGRQSLYAHLHFEWRQRRQGRLVAVDPSPLLQPIDTGASVAGRAPLPPLP